MRYLQPETPCSFDMECAGGDAAQGKTQIGRDEDGACGSGRPATDRNCVDGRVE